ncbi:MAG TPA: baseplate J/gp47 family protein [Burkholderiales bacterium]|nr:baseplate J/gp47 family protein [Burkholderiales bacterium]
MAEITKTDSGAVVDYTARDYDSLLAAMRALVPDKLPEWKDFAAEADFGNVLLQLFAHMGDILAYYQDRVTNESFLGTAQTRRSIIHHLRLISYRLGTAAPAAAKLQVSFPAATTGIVTVKRGFAFATKSRKDAPSVRFEYLGPDIDIDCDLIPPSGGRKVFATEIDVEEGRTVSNELLGTSDGRPNQRFRLARAGLILRSEGVPAGVNKDVALRTELGGVITEWAMQESLAFSRAGQNDFAVEIDADDRAEILFGDGDFGAVPPAGSKVTVGYRVGGGEQGNVVAGSIQTVVDAPALALAGAKITNQSAATGGAERESIEHAVAHAPQVFRSFKRAVTADDYEALALKYKGVGKVRAAKKNWNTVVLHVAPAGGGQVSDVLRNNLVAYFVDKRPVSTIIEIENVDYVKVYVEADVEIESYYSRAEMTEKIQKAAGGLLAFDAVDFARPIYLSKFYEAIEAIEGVKFVTIADFRRDRPAVPYPAVPFVEGTGKLDIDVDEVPKIPDGDGDEPYSGGIKIVLTGGY